MPNQPCAAPSGWPLHCGWLYPGPPEHSCVEPAGWSMHATRRSIVVCDGHHADGLRWVRAACVAGEEPRVVDLWPDRHGTLF